MHIKYLILLVLLFTTSCKYDGSLSNFSKETSSPELAKLTNNYTTIPSTYDISQTIDEAVSPPEVECIPKAIPVEEPVVDKPAPKAKHKLCDYPELGKKWVKNCENLYESEIPKDALEFTLKAFRNNFDKFRNNKCYIYTNKKGEGPKKNFVDAMKDGIPNKCQMVINNLKEAAPGTTKKAYPFRRKMYFIDICKGSVKTSYFNLGSGSFKNKYKNVSGMRSTVKGAFLTGKNVFNFVPGGKTSVPKYNALRQRMQKKYGVKKAHGLQLFGLQKTNNGSGPDSKYMHVSPFKSSWGCPSINEDNYWMIDELGKNGPSLVVNYDDGLPDIEDEDDCGSRR